VATKEERELVVQELRNKFSEAIGIDLETIESPDRDYESHCLVPVHPIITFVVDVTGAQSYHATKDVRVALYTFADKNTELHPSQRQWQFVAEIHFSPCDKAALPYALNALTGALIYLVEPQDWT
jgi:hypothetical protein